MHPFKISLTAVKLLCFANWLSTFGRMSVSAESSTQCGENVTTFYLAEFILEENDAVIFGQLWQQRQDD